MTRQCNGNSVPTDVSRGRNRSMSHHRNLAFHSHARNYSGGDDGEYSPTNNDSRSDRGDKKPRKRNSVACARCRKRKIKCTGDLNDGNGCEACQAAGASANSCFYLRVSSEPLSSFTMTSPQESEWPYSAPATSTYPSAVPRSTTDPREYSLASNMPAPSTAGPYLVQANSRTQPISDLSDTAYLPATPRHSFPFNGPAHMDTQMNHHYGSQQSRNVLPVHMSQPSSASYSTPEFAPRWTSLSSSGRQNSNSFAFDSDLSAGFQPSAYSYVPISVTTDGSSMFPALSPLASNLPCNSNSRTLPHPASISTSLQSSSISGQENDGSQGIFHHHIDRGNGGWDHPSRTSRGSVNSATQDTISASEQASSTSSSSPSDVHDGGSFGYSHFNQSRLGSNASASAVNSGNVSRRMSGDDSYASAVSGLSSSHVGASLLPTLPSSFNLQGMHGSFGVHDGSASSISQSSSLLGSQLPSSTHHMRPQTSASLDVPPVLRGSGEVGSQNRRSSHFGGKGLKSHRTR